MNAPAAPTAGPPALPAAARRGGLVWPIVLAGGLAMAAVAAVGALVSVQREQQEARNEALSAAVAGLQAQAKEAAALQADIVVHAARLQQAAQWSLQARWPATALRLLALSRSEGLWFVLATDTAAGLRLQGLAVDHGEVEGLLKRLAASPQVGAVELVALRPEADGASIRFTVDAALHPDLRPLARDVAPRSPPPPSPPARGMRHRDPP